MHIESESSCLYVNEILEICNGYLVAPDLRVYSYPDNIIVQDLCVLNKDNYMEMTTQGILKLTAGHVTIPRSIA